MTFLKCFNRVLDALMMALILFQAVLLILSVFFRYVLNSPIVWADELVRYSLVWMTFAGASLATRDNKHIVVDVIDLALPARARRATSWLADAVVVAFMVFMIVYGIKMTDYERGMFGETLTWFSYAYVYISIPIGAALTILFTGTKYLIGEKAE